MSVFHAHPLGHHQFTWFVFFKATIETKCFVMKQQNSKFFLKACSWYVYYHNIHYIIFTVMVTVGTVNKSEVPA